MSISFESLVAMLLNSLFSRGVRLLGLSNDQMMSQLDGLIAHWAATSTQASTSDAQAKGFKLVYLLPGMSVAAYWAIRSLDDAVIADALAATNPNEAARLKTLKTQQEAVARPLLFKGCFDNIGLTADAGKIPVSNDRLWRVAV